MRTTGQLVWICAWVFPLTLAAALSAQVVDSPEGSVAQMVPGGGAGKGSKVAADAGSITQTVYVAPSDDEQLSRALLELKGQQAAAGKYAADDPRRRDIDDQVAALREKIAARSLFTDATEGGFSDAPVAAPVYPRIVQETDLTMEPPPASFSAPPPAARPVTPTVSQEPPENAAARRLLEQTPVTMVADAQGLEKVLNSLQEQTHANFWVNWTALATVNVDRNTPVSLSLQQFSAERTLKVILSQVGGGTANLGYTIDGGLVTVSTREDLSSSKYQEVRVYDVRDLLAAEASLPAQFALPAYAGRVENLCDTLKTAVAPDTWRDAGGTIGSIRELNGLLIINQTADNHRMVETLLAKLRSR